MRLSVEKIKEAILHPDQLVREAAVYYLGDVCCHDPPIMALAIQSFDRYGLDTFGSFAFLIDLKQTSESIDWLVKEIERFGNSTGEKEISFVSSLQRVLRWSETDLLIQHFDTIHSMQHLSESSQRVIANRIAVDGLMADELWSEFDEFCVDYNGDTLDEDWEHGRAIVAALARDRDRACQKVIQILADPEKYSGWDRSLSSYAWPGNCGWKLLFRCWLIDLKTSDTWVSQEAQRALQKIGTDTVVRSLARRFVDGDWGHTSHGGLPLWKKFAPI